MVLLRERAQLIQVERHIAEAEAFICKQELIIEKLAARGHSTDDAQATLAALKGTLQWLRNQTRQARVHWLPLEKVH